MSFHVSVLTAENMDLSRKRDRDRLSARPDPYWQRLAKGAYLGFRRGPDTWLARYRGRDRKQRWQPLGEALEYDEAKRRAEGWIGQLSGSPVRKVKRDTVRAALKAYLADLERHGRHEAAAEAEWRFKATVWNEDKDWRDEIADVPLESATQDDFLEWRDRLTPGRLPRTVNRYVRAVVAGLNKAHELGHVGNPAAWTLTRLADDVEDEGETAVFLNPKQRRGLIENASSNTARFLRGLDLTGARPKELAATKASDFDGEKLRLAHRKGKPPKLRVRYAILSNEGAEFFSQQAQGRRPEEPLFTEDGETPWRRHVWSREVRKAITSYNEKHQNTDAIPERASAYSFRHARISELLQIYEIDPLTVAAQTGTSLAVIEKTYFRFIPSAMRAKLAAVKAIV